MKTVIFGSRTFTDYQLFSQVLNNIWTKEQITEIISGGAKGVDTLAIQWAKEHNYPVTIMPANWSQYGRAAGVIRNKEMAEIADMAIGFWDGNSRGTANMISTCRKLNVPGKIYRTDTKILLDIL